MQNNSIQTGNITNAKGIAIGTNASVNIREGLTTEEVTALMVELQNAEQPTVWDGRIPYLGLKAFQEDDAQFFFGREHLVAELIERLGTIRFLVIAGPSGSGKSSLARAGLLHAIKMGQIDGSDKWLRATMRPGNNPIEQTALSMARLVKSPIAATTLRETGLHDSQALHAQIETLLTDNSDQRCVLLVDQFEEVFTQTKNDSLREAFFALLTTAVTIPNGRTIVILSMRSDFVAQCARYEQLNELLSHNFRQVGGMQPEALARAITLPALEVGVKIDPALVSQITFDMKGEVGALPLMSFALRDLFEAEKTRKGDAMDMTLTEYQRRGGLQKALEHHTKRVFDTFSEKQIELAGSVFSKLVEAGQGRADTRRIVVFSELVPSDQSGAAVEEIVQAFAAEGVRLLATDHNEQQDERTVTITHEKLLEAWPWLNRLVDENRETIVLANRISDDARIWESLDRDEGALYRGARLAQIVELFETKRVQLSQLSAEFLEKGKQLATDEMIRLKREVATQEQLILRTRALLAGTVLVIIALAINPVRNGVLRFRANQLTKLVKLNGFWIEKYEVTNAQYRFCVRAEVCSVPNSRTFAEYAQDSEMDAVYGVSALQASSYCRWVNRQLPTEAEWILASESDTVKRIMGGVSEWTRTYYTQVNNNVHDWNGAPSDLSFDKLLIVRGSSELDRDQFSSWNGREDDEAFGIRCVSHQGE